MFYSCTNDGDIPVAPIPGAYENGFFVINEGSAAKGTVSFINNDLNIEQLDVYGDVNSNDALGGFVQSMFFYGEKAYIISGKSNVITIINRKTFKLIGKITTGLVNPRYGVVANGKAYITNSNSFDFTNDDFVAVINLSNNVVETKIALNTSADKITYESGKLYIIEPFDSLNVLVVNTTTNILETPINIGVSANSMKINNGFLYVIRNPFGVNSELIKIKLSDKTFTTLPFSSSFNHFLMVVLRCSNFIILGWETLNWTFKALKSCSILVISDRKTSGFWEARALAETWFSEICLVTLTDSSFFKIVFFAVSIVSRRVFIKKVFTASITFLVTSKVTFGSLKVKAIL